MIHGQTRDLFQLQTELVDMKVDMAVSRTIDRVVEQISALKNEMHDMRVDMNNQFSTLDKRVFEVEHRLKAVEKKLGATDETKQQIKSRFIDYSFKAIWAVLAVLGSVLTYVIFQLISLYK